MIWIHLIALICLLMFLVGHQNVEAQQQLPFGAKARFGINKGVITDTAFSPDRTQIAVASSVGIWLYDAATGTETALEPAMPFGVSAIAFSPDGKTIACGSDEGTIWLRHLDTGRIKHFPPIHTQHVLSVAFSPDGKTLASWSAGGAILLSDWDKIRSVR